MKLIDVNRSNITWPNSGLCYNNRCQMRRLFIYLHGHSIIQRIGNTNCITSINFGRQQTGSGSIFYKQSTVVPITAGVQKLIAPQANRKTKDHCGMNREQGGTVGRDDYTAELSATGWLLLIWSSEKPHQRAPSDLVDTSVCASVFASL